MRGSARKARVVLEHIRGKSVSQARATLQFTPRAAAREILSVLESAAANAEANHELEPGRAAHRGGLRRRGPDPQALAAACTRPRHAHPQAHLSPDRRAATRPVARRGSRREGGGRRGAAARATIEATQRARRTGKAVAPEAVVETDEPVVADEAVEEAPKPKRRRREGRRRRGTRGRRRGAGRRRGRNSSRRGRERRRANAE